MCRHIYYLQFQDLVSQKSLHYLLPLVLAALATVHFIALHGVRSCIDKVPLKDLHRMVIFAMYAIAFLFLYLLGYADNYFKHANSLVNPAHIKT